jgi:hypothetical protein
MFVDFEKAFDRVNREYIWSALSRRGIPEKVIAIIKESYLNASYRVLHSGQLSESFVVNQGARQSCIISPILFLILMNKLHYMA